MKLLPLYQIKLVKVVLEGHVIDFFVTFWIFVGQKVVINEKLRIMEYATGFLLPDCSNQIDHKLEKWQWLHIFLVWSHRHFLTRSYFFYSSLDSVPSSMSKSLLDLAGVMAICFMGYLTKQPKLIYLNLCVSNK